MAERTIVTLAFLAVFVVAMLTNHLTGQVEIILAGGMGMIMAAWFGGHAISSATINSNQAAQDQQAANAQAKAGGAFN